MEGVKKIFEKMFVLMENVNMNAVLYITINSLRFLEIYFLTKFIKRKEELWTIKF